jgi:tetratricopeptide (TPR) repeat protein
MVDPIRRQLLFDFERLDCQPAMAEVCATRRIEEDTARGLQELFVAAVQAEEAGEKQRAVTLYEEMLELDPDYAPGYINLGYADAHYNLALAYERKGERRAALRHWQAYARLDKSGPWSDHARAQIRKLLDSEKLAIAWRAQGYVAPRTGSAALELMPRPN